MQVYSDRFETVLPKEGRFFSPKTKPSRFQKPSVWSFLVIGILIGVVFMALSRPQSAPVALTPAVTVPTPAPPLPEVRRAMPVPVYSTNAVPRAQLIHVRGIGTVENDRMPDGRLLTTRYMGELASAANLPRNGAQLGDMWFTRNDGHCWVLAPLGAGSSTIGWIDP